MSKLLAQTIRPLTFGRLGQEHVWIRVPEYHPATFLTRTAGKPLDLLIRVPLSTLSKRLHPYDIKDYNRYPTHNEINWKTLQNARCFLMPRRSFGLNRKDPPFGHARWKGRINWVEPLVFAVLGAALFVGFIDWRKLKEDYGINILPELMYKGMVYGIDGENRQIKHSRRDGGKPAPSSEKLILAEEQDKIHAIMKRDADKRLLIKVASQDPEVAALVEGRHVENPIDSELYLLKKKYVEDLNFTPEELSETLSDTFISTAVAEEIENEGLADYLNKKVTKLANRIWSVKAEEDIKELESDLDEDKKQEKKSGFKDRKIIEYENRIRSYSTPDKIFRYFATYRMIDEKGHQEVMMTPQDFLRSITPGILQPANKGLDQFTNITKHEINSLTKDFGVEESSIFHRLGSGGLMTFSDYLFLLTVLSTSRRHFEIAFKMFDLNGDGTVDSREFENVTNLMRSQSSMGARHRDHGNTGSTLKGINSGLMTYFFGHNRKGILTVDDFLEFQRSLQNEILRLEFDRKRALSSDDSMNFNGEPSISEKDFGDLLIAYAGFPAKKKARMLKRVKNKFDNGNTERNSSIKINQISSDRTGITLSDYINFFKVLHAIDDIDQVLTFYNLSGAAIEKSLMKHIAETIADVKLRDQVIDVVFSLFDENEDGKLSDEEFVAIMKQRNSRGLDKPKNTGFCRIFSSIMKCAFMQSQINLCN